MVTVGIDQIARRGFYGARGLDITIKSAGPIGKAFAPTWPMVMGIKNGTMSWEEYRQKYIELMRWSYRKNPDAWSAVMGMDQVTLLCYCRNAEYCHRSLLQDLFVQMGAHRM